MVKVNGLLSLDKERLLKLCSSVEHMKHILFPFVTKLGDKYRATHHAVYW